MDAVTIYLDDRRRALGMWWQKMQHAVGGVPLLVAGIHSFGDPIISHRALAFAEIVVAGVLLVTLVRDVRGEVRARREHAREAHAGHAHGPDWFDVAAGALLILEAWRLSQAGGKAFYLRPYFLLGLLTLALGLLHGPHAAWLSRRRFVRVDDEGLHAVLSRFRRLDVRWADVRDLRLDARAIVVTTTTRTVRIALRRYRNASAVCDALASWRERRDAHGDAGSPAVVR